MLKENDKCPNLIIKDHNGQDLNLSDFKGKYLIVYFYPKDNTPGCTLESCGFRDAYNEFTSQDAEIIGVSKDTVASHQKFIKRFSLPFPLIADTDKKTCEAFGVLAEKSMFGKKYLGITRSTFLINPQGIIKHVWPKVHIAGHVKDVLETLTKLK